MFWAAVTLWSALRPSLSVRAHPWPPCTSGTSGVGTCGEGQRGLDPRPRLLLRVQIAPCWGPGPLSAQWGNDVTAPRHSKDSPRTLCVLPGH